jgi:3-oxoadipate enol-lactonase
VKTLVAGTTSARFTDEEWEAGRPVLEACQLAAAGTGDKGRVMDLLTVSTFSERYRVENATTLTARRALVASLPSQYFEGLLGILNLLQRLDLRPLLPRITCRTLIIGAELDRTFSVARSHEIAAAIPGARLEVIAGASHGVFLEDTNRVLSLIHAFIRG